MVPTLLVLALEFHRAPIRFAHLADPTRPLPECFGDWLVESSTALGPSRITATAEAIGTKPEALHSAFLFLLRQVLLTPAADHYRVLGLSRGCAPESIKRHHSLMVRMFHPDRLPGGDPRSGSLTARINGAYQILRDPERRARYDRSLPPLRRGGRWGGNSTEHARVGGLGGQSPWHSRLPLGSRAWSRRWLVWASVGVSLSACVLLFFGESSPPVLRVSPERADRSPVGPSYLRGTAAQRETAVRPDAGPRPVPESSTRLPVETAAHVVAETAGSRPQADLPSVPPPSQDPRGSPGPGGEADDRARPKPGAISRGSPLIDGGREPL